MKKMTTYINYKPRKGTKACFVGSVRIPTPKKYGNVTDIEFSALVKQAGFTIKEFNGLHWEDLNTKNLNLFKRSTSVEKS